MNIIAINKEVEIKNHKVISTTEKGFHDLQLANIDYLIVSGGDGLLRRIIESVIFSGENKPKIIIDPQGSFNVVAKKHYVSKLDKILKKIASGESLKVKNQDVYKLNDHVFLFSAGNLHDALHIHLAEILRIGLLKKGILKYLISTIFVLPIALVTLPFLVFSKKRFFIITPLKSFNFMNLYTKVRHLKVDLKNDYNLLEIDGDLIIIQDRFIEIKYIDEIEIVVG